MNATVKTTVSKLAVQKTPKTGNTLRYVYGGSTVGVICQVNNGGTADGKTSTTWDAISGGGWVYNPYVTTPATGIRQCGTGATVSTYNSAERGLIHRRPDPGDGRRQVISLSAAGREFFEDKRRASEEWLCQALQDRLTEAERHTVIQALALLDRLSGP
ncbi:MAG: winged helix-turn-helix transcriptional regulator [Actinobacteria bacterium]|nr:MAG: winged helix-turn-helix transcriptional regulator [Actinomycetota bacterium]